MRTIRLAAILIAVLGLPLASGEDRPAASARPASPAEPRQASVVQLAYADPGSVAGALNSIFSAAPTPLLTSPDFHTNSVILSAPPGLMQQAMDLIKSIDVPTKSARQVQMIKLRNARADRTAGLLDKVLSVTFPKDRSGSWLTVSADDRTNTLLLTASAQEMEAIRRIAEQLDADAAPEPATPEPQALRLKATVYEVKPAADKLASLDADKLKAQAKSGDIASALAACGATKTLYLLDQVVVLENHPSMKLGVQIPVPHGSSSHNGSTTTSVQYSDVGCIIELSGEGPGPRQPRGHAQITVELSVYSDSQVQLAPSQKAPIFRKTSQCYDGPIVPGEPVVLVTLDTGGGQDQPTAYVTHLEFRPVK